MSLIDLQWFAAEDEGRTEEPSEYKLSEARKEGRLPKSQELNGIIVYLLALLLLVVLAPWVERKLEEVMIFFFSNSTATAIDNRQFAYVFVRYFLMLTLPFALMGMIAGVVANIVQNRGWIFTTKTIQPKFNKIIPKFGEYFKKTLFSVEGLFNIAKSLVKVALVSVIAFIFIRSDMSETLKLLQTGGPRLAMRQIAGMSAKILIVSALVLLVIGVADFFMQRRTFRESMKMTKQEVKEEFKMLEGDQETKSRLEQAQRQMLSVNMAQAVRESDVVITNPTHYAVALKWDSMTADAPMISAKGTDMTAQNIKRIAREADVPIVENKALARTLYTETEIGDIIPEAYIRVVAAVYGQIGFMERQGRQS